MITRLKDLKPRLVEDWRWLLAKAWSLRFVLAAGTLNGADAAVQLIAPKHASWRFAAAAAVLSAAAFISRFVSQRKPE